MRKLYSKRNTSIAPLGHDSNSKDIHLNDNKTPCPSEPLQGSGISFWARCLCLKFPSFGEAGGGQVGKQETTPTFRHPSMGGEYDGEQLT